ncbi:MAG: hypothetical protein IH568_02375 [Burkholderiaceae bacterium]|nr:hypothetical protein [Burkholderiaceae bacterium]
MFKTWRGRLVRVGADCAVAIDAEKAQERAQKDTGGMGLEGPMQAPERASGKP